MYKILKQCEMPKWLKILINVTLTITCVYWIGLLVYKFLEVVRIFLHTMTEKKIWWIALGIMVSCVVVTLLILEFKTDLNPISAMWGRICEIFGS